MNRRGFLRLLGLGAGAVALLPVDELLDRLAFAKSPTSSIYLPPRITVEQWSDDMFAEYVRALAARDLAYYDGLKWEPRENLFFGADGTVWRQRQIAMTRVV